MLQNALLGCIRNRHHTRAALQRPIQPQLLHQPALDALVIIQETVVMNRQDDLPALEQNRRKIDVTCDVDDVSFKLTGLECDLNAIDESLAEPACFAPLYFPFGIHEMRVEFSE